jgi:hypothetical protein
VTFVGRLATYRYYNMDQVVGQALATFRRLDERKRALEAQEEAEEPLIQAAGVTENPPLAFGEGRGSEWWRGPPQAAGLFF